MIDEPTQPEEPWTVPRLTDDEMSILARRIVQNEVYMAMDAVALDCSFGAFLALVAPSIPKAELSNIATVYEDIDEAGTWAVNGYPSFLSCKFVHKDDMRRLAELITGLYAAMDGVAPRPT